MRGSNFLLALLLAAGLAITGCQKPVAKPQYDRPLPQGQLALRKITNPYEIPDFAPACHNLAWMSQAIDNSLNYLNKPSSQKYFPYGQPGDRQQPQLPEEAVE